MIARYRNFLVPVVLVLVLGAAGCSSAKKEESLLDELANLDKGTLFNRAEELYSKGDYKEARELFSFVYDSFPNDPLGHKAALRVADTYAVKNDVTSLTEERLRYRDFVNRYPNDPDRDYAARGSACRDGIHGVLDQVDQDLLHLLGFLDGRAERKPRRHHGIVGFHLGKQLKPHPAAFRIGTWVSTNALTSLFITGPDIQEDRRIYQYVHDALTRFFMLGHESPMPHAGHTLH